jgi:hypothetical protein
MSWALYAMISNLSDGLWTAAAIKIPVALAAPPAALLVTGLMTKWALRGFGPNGRPDDAQTERAPGSRLQAPLSIRIAVRP